MKNSKIQQTAITVIALALLMAAGCGGSSQKSGLSERESLFYLLWLVGTTTAAYAIPLGELNLWDHVDSATTVVATVAGAIYFYSCNGGASGTEFLARYVSLNWVVGIRFTPRRSVFSRAFVWKRPRRLRGRFCPLDFVYLLRGCLAAFARGG